MNIIIFDPTRNDKTASFRGGGRIIQILKENLHSPRHPESRHKRDEGSSLNEIKFVSELSAINYETTLLIPSWQPFQPPRLNQHIAKRQILMIFDVIPLKYPDHFPIGIRGSFNLWRNKRALKNIDKIITISEHSKKDIVQYLNVPEEKVAVVYPAVSKIFTNTKTLFSNVYPLPPQFMLYVGDVNWNKNLVNLAKAIKKANIPCVFAGKMFGFIKTPEVEDPPSIGGKTSGVNLEHPWQQEFKQFLEEVGNDKRFIFLGYVPDEDLIGLYQKALCNILVSRDEGFGYSYAEAASQSCPSVLSDIDIFHEIAGDTARRAEPLGTALFADPNNPDAIAEQISFFAKDINLRNGLAEKAYKRVLQMYNADNFTRQLESIFIK